VKIGDLVKLKEPYQASLKARLHNLPEVAIIDWVHPNNTYYVRLHNMQVEVLAKYYEVINESR